MIENAITQIITGYIGSFGFALLFNIRGKRLIVASLGGLISWSLFLVLNTLHLNDAVNYFLVALAVSIYAEIMARLLKTPTTTFITTSLIPLIPGSSLYYTMAYAFGGNIERFLEKAIYTLQLASALALGIILATTSAKIFTKLKAKQ